MKKYRLIKEYPGSPKLGFILDDSWKCKYTGNHGTYTINTMNFNPKSYTDHWEEIIEKDYEILSILYDQHIYTLSYEVRFNNLDTYLSKTVSGHCYLSDLDINFKNPENNAKIHSVKRLSDGKVFTIGDKVDHLPIEDLPTYKLVTIEKFVISGEKIEVFGQFNIGMLGFIYLEYLTKSKQPLFKTEDGVDIYEDDEVVCFDKEDWITRNEKYKFQPFDVKDKNYLFFSTKEKAEEYILMNKPVLSINDVLTSQDGLVFAEKKLKELVKQKLNKNN